MSQPPNQPYSGYPEHGGQSYPGYPQPQGQSYPGYSQPQEQGYPGYSQPQQPQYPGHHQPSEQSYPGYNQPQEQPYPGYSQPQEQGYPGYSQPQQPQYPGHHQPSEQSYPGYNQPQEQAYPGYPVAGTPSAPPKKSGAGKIVLIVLVAILALCGGGTAVAFFAFKDDVEEVAKATQTHVVAPETLAGRPKMTEPELQEVADQMVAEMKSEVTNAKETVGAFYGDIDKEDMVMIAAVSGLVADPAKEVDEGIRGMAAGGLKTTNVAPIEPGPLGGVAKCGDATVDDIKLGVCIWADKGSVGVIALYFKTSAQAKAEFVKIRSEIEQVS